ncbi:MCE family protein [Mycolicibacterium aubagnense]|uniref:Mammalian cell entry protein n=1 Tax=Mycolicibacterium aubagnense TaxID=319707 RepID=A0ABM7IF10_9MYCO|nr:MlaD family protein [Mycolicibacterium aubagnense]TLH49592.1 mammalian cell entry protein [Mycolicibacterium aubagnense]WGI32988.1 MlaD family protein [Mycolicibacterium aubagnense]BBX85331.1 mammalian cell entry protein [Mycolicibacterium aubagnense]
MLRLRLSRTVWIQLAILGAVTVIACSVMAFGFVHVPTLLGFGRYTVTVELPESGGLYPTSVVTYRGTEIGRVSAVDVTPSGVRAELNLDSSVKVPADVSAAVHSRSAVGEQFIELIPAAAQSDASPALRGDATIPVSKVQIPADIGNLLDATNRALEAIPQENLRTVVDEADKAVGGLGPELSRLVNGSTSLAIEAGKNVDPITQLIGQSPAVLNSQVQTADSIAAWAQRLASITGQFKAQNAAFAELLQLGGPALDEGRALFDRFAPALPVLLANMVSLGEIAVVYRHDIEQLLVLFPQGTALMSAIAVADSDLKTPYRGIYLDFKLNMNLPPPCNTGFLPIKQQRIPAEVDYPERPAGELYCRVPQDSDLNVRGVRNIPCENNPAKRAPTVELCESNEQYVPLNDGYVWKGDPNATLTGQGVPQYAPGTDPRQRPGAPPGPAPPVAVVPYDPATGGYIGPDGKPYTDSDLAATTKGKTWQSMLTPNN